MSPGASAWRWAFRLVFPFLLGLIRDELLVAAGTNEVPVPVPGWRMELVASAPEIRHPSVVACAPDGRVFVAEDPMDITRPAQVAEGRILCRHPDGHFTVFAEGLHAVFGMQYLEGRLYVLHNPRFSVFRDDHGVGRDRFEIIGQTNPNPWALDWNDHVPANFKLGMDGFFYIAVGDKGLFGATGRDGRRVDLHGGGIVRIRPDGTGLEVFSTGVRNILDVALTDEDDLFTYDNTDENHWMGRVTHMVDGGFYGYPFDFIPRRDYTLWNLADYGAGAATGTTAVTGDALPAEYRGNLFLADFGQRNVRRVTLTREGGSFRAVADQLLFPNPPGDFRPVGIAFTDDDSALYICDWQHRDTKEQAVTGRLWKLSWNGSSQFHPRPTWYPAAAAGRPAEASIPALLESLDHPAHSLRIAAQRQLSRKGTNAVVDLARQLASESTPARARIHALWALHGIDGAATASNAVAHAARSSHAALARQALRQIGESAATHHAPLLLDRLDDSDASIRFHSATALGRIASPESIPRLIGALEQQDLFARHATTVALQRIGRRHPSAWPAIVTGLGHASARVREGTTFVLRDAFDAQLVRVLADLASDRAVGLVFRTNALHCLAPLHHQPAAWNGEWWAYHPFRLPPPARTVAWAGTPRTLETLLAATREPEPTLRLIAIRALKDVRSVEVGSRLLEQFPTEPDADVRDALVTALAALKPDGADATTARYLGQWPDASPFPKDTLALARSVGGPRVTQVLLDLVRDRPDSVRALQAVELLGGIGASNVLPTLASLMESDAHPLQSAAIRAVGQMGGPDATAALVRRLAQGPTEVRAETVRALTPLRATNSIPALLAASADPALRPGCTEALLLLPDPRALDLYLDALASRQASLRSEARRALGRIQGAALPLLIARLQQLPPAVVGELQQVYRGDPAAMATGLFAIETPRPDRDAFLAYALANTGDAARGRQRFHDRAGVACIQCHRVQGEGTGVGPDLSGAGAQFDRRTLAESILWPNRAVREGYNLVEIELTDGEELAGMIRAETSEAISIQPASGEPISIPRNRIRTRRQTTQSLMPEGLEGSLSLEDFSDLLSYLETLRSGT